jgi:hypothetical protein
MYPPGREALLQDPTVAEALQRVAAEGWEEEARMHAQSALTALSDRQRDPDHEQAPDQKHVMVSYQWDVQQVCLDPVDLVLSKSVSRFSTTSYTDYILLYICLYG